MSYPCLILAAGLGTRMGDLTRERPKALIEVAGRPLIAHALAAAREAGAAPIAVNGHHRAKMLAGWIATHAPDVTFLRETPDILDSGGAVRNALSVLGPGPVFTLNADAVFRGGSPLIGLASAWDGDRMEALLALVPRSAAVGRRGGGDFSVDGDGRLDWDRSAGAPAYIGAQILRTERIAAHPEPVFSLREVWEAMRRDGGLFGTYYAGEWADVGHPGGIAEAERMVGHDPAL